jgi:hypothetical protein
LRGTVVVAQQLCKNSLKADLAGYTNHKIRGARRK